ncbi:MAG: GlmU family protein [Cytophagaceae bacterium]|nr:GlmU family protein [Cytophagaceae bacterium]
MNVVIYDPPQVRANFLPLSFTRPLADMRIGILRIVEKWEKRLGLRLSYKTEDYLQEKFPLVLTEDTLFINACVCPTDALAAAVKQLQPGHFISSKGQVLAYRQSADQEHVWEEPVLVLQRNWDLFRNNGAEIRNDFNLLTQGRKSAGIQDVHTRTYAEHQIFVEPGVKIRAAILNAEDGPIYLGANSEVQEGAIIKGPFALGEHAVVNMGGKMRGDNTIGPYCKVGGEVSNSILFGYSNKAHEGFMGNSVIGEWCNLGADSNTSNLKNNYSNIKVYSYPDHQLIDSGLQFCGLVMGDHSKCGINIMFDSGTVVGVNANVFGVKYSPKFIPSFSWGDIENLTTFQLDKAYEIAGRMMARRNLELTEIEKRILWQVYQLEVR